MMVKREWRREHGDHTDKTTLSHTHITSRSPTLSRLPVFPTLFIGTHNTQKAWAKTTHEHARSEPAGFTEAKSARGAGMPINKLHGI